jgi:hypothetical protein
MPVERDLLDGSESRFWSLERSPASLIGMALSGAGVIPA